MTSSSPSPLRPPFTGATFATPNVSLSNFTMPRVQKTAIDTRPPVNSQVGPNTLRAGDSDVRVCYDTSYGKEERICSPPLPYASPDIAGFTRGTEILFLKLIEGFIDAVKSYDFDGAISFTSPTLRETWNGPQKISNLSNFQEYLYNAMSPLKFLSIVGKWRSKQIQIMPNLSNARVQVETIDVYGLSHSFVFEFERNYKFDTYLVQSPLMEWKISKIYPAFGDMDEFF